MGYYPTVANVENFWLMYSYYTKFLPLFQTIVLKKFTGSPRAFLFTPGWHQVNTPNFKSNC